MVLASMLGPCLLRDGRTSISSSAEKQDYYASNNQPRQQTPWWRKGPSAPVPAPAPAYFAATHGQHRSADGQTARSSGGRAAAKRRKKKHATIKGRPIVKGGKERGLWRSIFGPRPLLEVHSIDQLSQLVDAEGWGLEDLSVHTGGPRPAESAAATTAIAAADVDGVALESAAAAAKGATSKVTAEPGVTSGGGAVPATVKSNNNGEGYTDAVRAEDIPVVPTPSIPPQELHPAVQALLERATAGTKPSMHGDGRKIGLAIEGGGMRGCVAAGMASCLHFLGMADSFDCVYGASAGSLIGAYFVSRQSNGTAVYHDVLPSAGARFIDMSKFPQALGFELPKVPRKGSGGASGEEELGALEAARAASFARVIGLDFLLEEVVGRVHGLDFGAFSANDKLQPLHVVASGVSSMGTVSLASRRGYFSTLDELTGCIRASMLVPGLAGPLVSVPKRQGDGGSSLTADSVATPPQEGRATTLPPTSDPDSDSRVGGGDREAVVTASSPPVGREGREDSVVGSGAGEPATAQPRAGFLGTGNGGVVEEEDESLGKEEEREVPVAAAPVEAFESNAGNKGGTGGGGDASELLVDAMVFEPLPYRSAIEDGCTDVVVLCTRPEGSQVLGKKPSIYESRVVKKFFEQHDDPDTTSGISNSLQQLEHLRVYAEDALVLGEGSRTGVAQAAPKGGAGEGREAFLLAIAPAASSKEVGQLEMDRRAILQGCRDGFAACYDAFVGPAKSLAAAAADGGADVVGPLARSGAEMAVEYFPDSLLSTPVDLNATYLETGHLISDNQAQGLFSPLPPLAPTGEKGSGATEALEGGGGGRGAFGRLWLGRNNGGDASSPPSPLKISPSDGRRGLLRRLLSRRKLGRKPSASSSRPGASAPAPPEAVVTEGAGVGAAAAAAAEPTR
ncbi:unnamed protein product [Ectocarpus fasciculatus]